MKVILNTNVLRFPLAISAEEAMRFYKYQADKHEVLMVMAANWREIEEPGEEGWFEELGPDEFEGEDFFIEFSAARLELWPRQTKRWIVQTRKKVLWRMQ